MKQKKLTSQVLASLVDSLSASQTVYAPVAKGDKFDFAPIKSAKQMRLDYDVTLLPPKKYFQPPVEKLLTFDMNEGYKSVIDDEKFVLLGVHPYDMVALNQMDKIWSSDNYDTHYMTRRKNATIVALDVVTPSENVFAASMGTAVVKEGYDLLLTKIGDDYLAEAATEKGEKMLQMAKDAPDATGEDLNQRHKVQEANKEKLNKHPLKCKASFLPRLLERAYDHPVWEETARTCFNCGSCNQVCPTCYCFNVQDDVNWDLQTGKRTRSWDGCLLDGFTKVAPDHEFRAKRGDRFRHRLYRKAKYVPGKIGEIACVGCGRCVGACLPDIANPVKIYNRLIDEIGIG